MRNHEVVKEQFLLDKQGEIAEPGWSRKLLQTYRRDDIKASSIRIKEWDYYLIMGNEFGIAMTISDLGYIGMQSASFLDFKNQKEHTETVLNLLPMGKMNLPTTSLEGVTTYKDKRVDLKVVVENGIRHLTCDFKKFDGEKNLQFDILLKEPDMDSLVIATPWDEKYHFYYNQKINCLPASGWVNYGGQKYQFDEATDFGTLDWGRGVWTYDNEWYWGSGNSIINGKPFGFNIGYGFGNTTAASENIIFYDGKGHKLDDITCHLDYDDYKKPWKVTSSDKRFEMEFVPILDRSSETDFKIIGSWQHQVFGYMSGTAVLDDGTKLEIKDVLCFIEHVHNKY